MRQLTANAGQEGAVIVERLLREKASFGYNVDADKYEDLIQAGIIDPTKVSRTAIENASSVAGMLLMTEALVAEKPEEEKTPPMPPPGGGAGMY